MHTLYRLCLFYLQAKTNNHMSLKLYRSILLGVADKIRQTENLNWDQFVELYKNTLSEHGFLPSIPVGQFIEMVGKLASKNSDLERVMRCGAQSIQSYIAEGDAEAPLDVLMATAVAEKNPASFKEINQWKTKGTVNNSQPSENIKTEFSVINCPECSSKLRIPAGKKGKVTCPKCGHSFITQPL